MNVLGKLLPKIGQFVQHILRVTRSEYYHHQWKPPIVLNVVLLALTCCYTGKKGMLREQPSRCRLC